MAGVKILCQGKEKGIPQRCVTTGEQQHSHVAVCGDLPAVLLRQAGPKLGAGIGATARPLLSERFTFVWVGYAVNCAYCRRWSQYVVSPAA